MLLRLIYENFLSFNDRVQFDMFPNPKRTYLNGHIYDQKVPVLKMSGIYGNVGAGKTNIIKGARFLKEFVLDKSFLSLGTVKRYQFRLKTDAGSKPLVVKVEFCNEGHYFIYEVAVSTQGVEKEALYESGLGKSENVLIFNRQGMKLHSKSTPQKQLQAAINSLLSQNRFSSVMALNREFPLLPEKNLVDCAYNWFEQKLQIITADAAFDRLVNMLHKDLELYEYTRKIFHDIKLGIEDIDVKYQTFEDFIQNKDIEEGAIPPEQLINAIPKGGGIASIADNRQKYDFIIEDGIKKVGELLFKQLGVDGYVGNLDILAQSDGTLRILTLMPAFHRSTVSDTTYFIDEINNSLHPLLISQLIKYFAQDEFTKGQLVFTTHEVQILDNSFVRPDEIWIAEKEEGSTDIYSLNDFKEHRSLSLKRGYLEGRYGGIPEFFVNPEKN